MNINFAEMGITEDEANAVLRKIGSAKASDSLDGLHFFAKALELPLRKGLMSGDNKGNIFQPIDMVGKSPEFPLDMLSPGSEKDFVAFVNPGHGRIPERRVESDYVMVTTYDIANAIDYLLRYARDARWDVVGRATEIFEGGFIKKLNDDGWQTVISAAVDRNIVVYDGDAGVGQFTKRLLSLAKIIMRRNGGGNSTSTNRGKLTDVFMSPECLEDIRNWGPDQLDDVSRREVYVSDDGQIAQIQRVKLHDMDEFGENQEYQDFYTDQMAASLAATDVELLIGLDLSKSDSFVMPVTHPLQVFEDTTMHRSQLAGIYGWLSAGFGVLDNRRVLALSA